MAAQIGSSWRQNFGARETSSVKPQTSAVGVELLNVCVFATPLHSLY